MHLDIGLWKTLTRLHLGQSEIRGALKDVHYSLISFPNVSFIYVRKELHWSALVTTFLPSNSKPLCQADNDRKSVEKVSYLTLNRCIIDRRAVILCIPSKSGRLFKQIDGHKGRLTAAYHMQIPAMAPDGSVTLHDRLFAFVTSGKSEKSMTFRMSHNLSLYSSNNCSKGSFSYWQKVV